MVETRESMKNALSVGHSYTFDRSATMVLFRCLGLVILGVLLGLLHSSSIAAQTPAKNVLVLSSFFERSHASLDLMESSLRAHAPWPVTFSVSSLENPRFEEESYRESLAETFRRGYSGKKLDLVMTTSEPALRFAVQYRDKMFPGVPIVFWSISTALADQKMPGVTGVATPAGTRGTIDLALRLHPDTTAVAVITGESQTEKDWMADVHSELRRHRDKVREIDIIGPPSSQMLKKVAALPPHTVVLFALFPQDSTQPPIGSWDVLALTAERLPTYSMFQTLALDRGGIGGAYYDATADSSVAGKLGARVLSGERPDSIPVVHLSNLQIKVDWRQLRRWHIPESTLPPGSIVLYREPSLWESYRKYILAAIVLIVAQALLIIGLLWQRARKEKAEAVLLESEERFRVMADTTPSLIWMCNPHGKITYLNERRLAFTGPDPKGGYSDSWVTYVHPDDVENMVETLSQALKTRQPFSQEYRLRNRDGVYRWMFDVASPRVNGDGSFAGFIGSVIDTTDQKLAQQALEKISGQLIEAQEQERSRIARELHDDYNQRLAMVAIDLDELAENVGDSSVEAHQRLHELFNRVNELSADLHSLSHRLHSSTLESLGLVAGLKAFCEEFRHQQDIQVDFAYEDVPPGIPENATLCIFRVAQEALRNIKRHSGANRAEVRLEWSGERLHLLVSDRGRGFDPTNPSAGSGIGILSMEERLRLLGGRLEIHSRPAEGTRVDAWLPFKVAAQRAG